MPEEMESPQTSLPANAGGVSETRDEMIENVVDEVAGAFAGETQEAEEKVVEELVAKEGDLTIEDLRKLPESAGLSDEELMAQWKAAQDDAKPLTFAHKVYDADGKPIEDLKQVSIADIVNGKLQFGYTANGKEQRKALADVFRVAQLGHYNEEKTARLIAERNAVYERYSALEQQAAQFAKERSAWGAALEALRLGNTEPIKKLVNDYAAALAAQPGSEVASPEQLASEREQEAAGMSFIYGTIVPFGQQLAKDFGANPEEVTREILRRIEQEPVAFLTREKIDAIMNVEVPATLEELGYRRNNNGATSPVAPANAAANAEVESLKKQMAALQATIAESRNASTQKVRDRSKKIPPSGGGATSSAGDAMPSMKSREDMKKWFRGETN